MTSLADVEKWAGLTIPTEVLTATPTSDKIIVLIEVPEAATKGGIIKPEEVIAREQGGSGWIVALGPMAGAQLAEAAQCKRDELLGLKVCWGRYAGEALVVTDRDDEFRSRFRIIREEHVMCVLTQPC